MAPGKRRWEAGIRPQIQTGSNPSFPTARSIKAIAKTLDTSDSELLRETLLKGLPDLRARADAEIRRREKLPHGVTAGALEKAVANLYRQFLRGEPVRIEQQDLLAPESKALWAVLGCLWGEEVEDKDRKSVAAALKAAPPKK